MTAPPGWLSVEEARARILDHVSVMPVEERPLLEAFGQVVAEDVRASFSIPPADNTAMDGYAVQSGSTTGASSDSPVTLRVVGELAAGYVYNGEVGPGEAVRIMTGASVPAGADTIVPFEETDEDVGHAPRGTGALSASVRVLKAALPGANVRRAGEDIREGDLVVRAGDVVTPARAGVLASLGRATVAVHRRPVVAILSTGDEVLEPGEPRRPGTIYDSNSYTLAGLVQQFGGIPRRMGIARDTIEDVTVRLREAIESADLVVTSAGVSRGDFDVVKEVLRREGDIDFWLVRMRPGKPLAFGSFTAADGRHVPHLGLPGNPVSSAVTFELFGRPALQKALGLPLAPRRSIRAVTDDRIRMPDGRRFYARVRLREEDDGWHATLTGAQGSGVLTSMLDVDGLVVVPEDSPDVLPGEQVQVLLLQ